MTAEELAQKLERDIELLEARCEKLEDRLDRRGEQLDELRRLMMRRTFDTADELSAAIAEVFR